MDEVHTIDEPMMLELGTSDLAIRITSDSKVAIYIPGAGDTEVPGGTLVGMAKACQGMVRVMQAAFEDLSKMREEKKEKKDG